MPQNIEKDHIIKNEKYYKTFEVSKRVAIIIKNF